MNNLILSLSTNLDVLWPAAHTAAEFGRLRIADLNLAAGWFRWYYLSPTEFTRAAARFDWRRDCVYHQKPPRSDDFNNRLDPHATQGQRRRIWCAVDGSPGGEAGDAAQQPPCSRLEGRRRR